MNTAKNQEQQLIAKIRLLGFSNKKNIAELKETLIGNRNLMTALESLVKCREQKNYQLSLSQISKIALSAHAIENLNAYKMYYPQLKKYGFEIDKLLDIIEVHEPFIFFPILVNTLRELKPKGWSDKSIQKLFCVIQHFEKIDLLKQYFFQFKDWHLSKIQIQNLLTSYTAPEMEKLISCVLELQESGYALNNLLDIMFIYGLEHLRSLKDFNDTAIAKHYTRHEVLAMTKHADGCQRLYLLKINYADLKAMGYTPIKIKLIILQDLHQPNSFIQKNMHEYDHYLHEMHTNRQTWFHQEVFSMFATSQEIDERCTMYLEEIESKKLSFNLQF